MRSAASVAVVAMACPQEKRTWIENGVVKNMYYSRYWADKKGVQPIPAPGGFIMLGGTQSLADLIKSTEKGILVTRFWYIRAVDPQTLLVHRPDPRRDVLHRKRADQVSGQELPLQRKPGYHAQQPRSLG